MAPSPLAHSAICVADHLSDMGIKVQHGGIHTILEQPVNDTCRITFDERHMFKYFQVWCSFKEFFFLISGRD